MEKIKRRGKKVIGMIMAVVLFTLIFGAVVPAVIAGPPIPPGDNGIYYLVPRDSGTSQQGSDVTIDVLVNHSVTDLKTGSVLIETSSISCGNITSSWCNGTQWPQANIAVVEENGKKARLTYGGNGGAGIENPPGEYPIGTITVECNSSTFCIADLNFIPGIPNTYVENDFLNGGGSFGVGGEHGTFSCGALPSFSKSLYAGWNLVSLPLVSEDNSTNSVLASVWQNVTDMYKHNGTSKQFEVANTMDPGEGYFVYVTRNCEWNYTGESAYTSIDESLKQGLNMPGWLNCSMSITDALSNISGDYNYAAHWNATTQKYEVYEPDAPAEFNDFDTMDPGEGYWIAAKLDCVLTKSCAG